MIEIRVLFVLLFFILSLSLSLSLSPSSVVDELVTSICKPSTDHWEEIESCKSFVEKEEAKWSKDQLTLAKIYLVWSQLEFMYNADISKAVKLFRKGRWTIFTRYT